MVSICKQAIPILRMQSTQSLEFKKAIVIFLIKTHDSESQGQEEAGRTRRMNELFTGSTSLKLVNALNKPPLKLSLSYQGSACSNYIESVIQQWSTANPEYLPM